MVTKEKALYTTREAAEVVCCHIKTLRDYITDGKLRAVRRGGGNYLIRGKDLRALLELEPDETLTYYVEDDP